MVGTEDLTVASWRRRWRYLREQPLKAVELINISGWFARVLRHVVVFVVVVAVENVLLILLINFLPLSVGKCQSMCARLLAVSLSLFRTH